ncbi:MAG: hypothetical protein CBB92_10290 [Flammeovirgaceae bacterium TMED32]|nr:MAG: hypothetical protein CBB92_10290 [Flammeovirgaceae bacterium TMED32]|tara:strand:+ start:514 stop:774 length:261 start_codon:yes stop_codon:yes gene_type:complete
MYTEWVVTAINSDDSNSGRRLNQEAAKSVKYSGLSEENVWKMVTLNPAKLLHLNDRMGSIKVGKGRYRPLDISSLFCLCSSRKNHY